MVAFTAFTLLLCFVHGTIESEIDEQHTVFKYTVDRRKEGDKSDVKQCSERNHTFYNDVNFTECIANTAGLGEQFIYKSSREEKICS